jgi:hypothetical protein
VGGLVDQPRIASKVPNDRVDLQQGDLQCDGPDANVRPQDPTRVEIASAESPGVVVMALRLDGRRVGRGEGGSRSGGYSVKRYFNSTHKATMPSRQVIFFPS